jgi:hypothetical protein
MLIFASCTIIIICSIGTTFGFLTSGNRLLLPLEALLLFTAGGVEAGWGLLLAAAFCCH